LGYFAAIVLGAVPGLTEFLPGVPAILAAAVHEGPHLLKTGLTAAWLLSGRS